MTFIFRTDSSSEIGHGHLMRCLALAKELSNYDSAIHFICREHSGSAHQLVVDAGYILHLLLGKEIEAKSSEHRAWLGCTQLEDAKDCRRIIENLPGSHVIVDHYGIDIEWESQISCRGITVIDDLADRSHQCVRLVDQSLVHQEEDYAGQIEGNFDFWGGSNVILRDEFREGAEWCDIRRCALMVCMGGADPRGATIGILKALLEGLGGASDKRLVKRIDVVVGNAFDRTEELEKSFSNSSLDVVLHREHQNISALMIRSDVCILSGGTMILEACSLGVPAIGVALAENQMKTIAFLAENNAILALDIENEVEKRLPLVVENAVSDRSTLVSLSRQGQVLVDKYAARKIARAIADEN